MQKSISSIYFTILGAMIGIEVAVGALMAPVIFFPAQFLGDGVLTHFQSGILMTQVFLKYNIILLLSVMIAWAYEAYMFKVGKKDIASFLLLMLVTTCAFLFVLYFTPFILHAQKLGADATTTAEFASMHTQSEWDMKVLMLAQLGLFIRRFWVLFK